MSTIISTISVILMYTTIIIVLITCIKVNRYINIKTKEINKAKAYEEAKREIQEINNQLYQKEDKDVS